MLERGIVDVWQGARQREFRAPTIRPNCSGRPAPARVSLHNLILHSGLTSRLASMLDDIPGRRRHRRDCMQASVIAATLNRLPVTFVIGAERGGMPHSSDSRSDGSAVCFLNPFPAKWLCDVDSLRRRGLVLRFPAGLPHLRPVAGQQDLPPRSRCDRSQ